MGTFIASESAHDCPRCEYWFQLSLVTSNLSIIVFKFSLFCLELLAIIVTYTHTQQQLKQTDAEKCEKFETTREELVWEGGKVAVGCLNGLQKIYGMVNGQGNIFDT